MEHDNTLPKSQRLCSRYLIDKLFEPGGSRSFAAFPMRLVIQLTDEDNTQLLISVPKRYFKHAVDRNRVKRQVREAYRCNKDLLKLPEGKHAIMAVIWLDSKHYPSAKVKSKVCNLLHRASESISAAEDSKTSEATNASDTLSTPESKSTQESVCER